MVSLILTPYIQYKLEKYICTCYANVDGLLVEYDVIIRTNRYNAAQCDNNITYISVLCICGHEISA